MEERTGPEDILPQQGSQQIVVMNQINTKGDCAILFISVLYVVLC